MYSYLCPLNCTGTYLQCTANCTLLPVLGHIYTVQLYSMCTLRSLLVHMYVQCTANCTFLAVLYGPGIEMSMASSVAHYPPSPHYILVRTYIYLLLF